MYPFQKTDLQSSQSIYQAVVDATLNNIRALVINHQKNNHTDFLLWLISAENPYQKNYIQISGINKMAELAVALLKDNSPQNFMPYTNYIGALNAFFVFEAISDNLAIGLAFPEKNDKTWESRKEILTHFNDVMQKKLAGHRTNSIDLLLPYKKKMDRISSFEYSLTTKAMKKITEFYLATHPRVTIQDLEYSIATYLTLNIDSCLQVLQVLADHPLTPLLQESLMDRYKAVNNLINNINNFSLNELADYGAKTILVTPTLLYLIGIIDKISSPSLGRKILQNIHLLNATTLASSLIRLLNDIGTPLLTSSHKEIKDLAHNMSAIYKQQSLPFRAFLAKTVTLDPFAKLLARINKDLKYREYNISLYNLSAVEQTPITALTQFFCNVQFFADLYIQQKESLAAELAQVNRQFGNNYIGQLIERMVNFHEILYANDYENSAGDYATGA